jgi:16S rRNA (adenine1518-N6/adenine1519-N6)-dimethyltransferase
VALKKSLSQHLLKDKNLLNKLVKLAGIGPDDVVAEIGSGRGDLTRCIIPRARFVHAIELDKQFRESLEPLEHLFPNVTVTFDSILNVSLRSFVKDERIKVMGNIPYNITGDILFKLLSEMDVIESAHLTMQKEVGERLASKCCSRSYGALSVIFQLYASVKLLLKLKPSLFIPPPEVDSVFIAIMFKHDRIDFHGQARGNLSSEHGEREGEAGYPLAGGGSPVEGATRAPVLLPDQGLIDFIKACFRYKRKYLRHSLEPLLGKERVQALYAFMDFHPSVRAEELEPKLYERMYAFAKD